MKIAPGIHRIGDSSIVNSYLVEQAGEVTIIDAGVPAFYKEITGELAAMGRTIADVRALVLTHGHTDHIGFAERFRRERRAPVSIHEADAALARGEVPNPAKGYGHIKLGPFLGFLWFTLLRGGLRTPKLQEVATFGDGATLDVPGSPRVILTPGHTPGSAALHVPSLGALFIGDAFATYAVTTGTRGPQIAPFTADAAQASHPCDTSKGSLLISCFRGMATPGLTVSKRRFDRYAKWMRRADSSTQRTCLLSQIQLLERRRPHTGGVGVERPQEDETGASDEGYSPIDLEIPAPRIGERGSRGEAVGDTLRNAVR